MTFDPTVPATQEEANRLRTEIVIAYQLADQLRQQRDTFRADLRSAEAEVTRLREYVRLA